MKRGGQKARSQGNKQAPGSIRIISGQWRGRKLPVISLQGLRPTTDRTKETLFNWLMPYLHQADCLDAFAGSGSLGLEALSRYANSATFVEMDVAAAQQIEQNLNTLKVTEEQANVINGNCLQVLQQLHPGFDIVFLDPPFHQSLLQPCIEQLSTRGLVKSDGLVYLECESPPPSLQLPANWQRIKHKSTRQVEYQLYRVS